jgi:predicted RNase H-like nuclease (RuvC/YqgF family)
MDCQSREIAMPSGVDVPSTFPLNYFVFRGCERVMKRIRSRTRTTLAWVAPTLASAILMFGPPAMGALGSTDQLDRLLLAQAESDNAAQASQKAIEALDDQTQDLGQKYRRVLENTKSIKDYTEHLRKQVQSQRDEIASIQSQLASIESTSRDVFPLMQRMVETLEQFVKLDVPYLIEERTKRVQGLKDIMDRADVTVSEKYRRILEAYQIEMEAGRTLEAYDGLIGEGESAKAVSFLRAGRVALAYQTTDGGETGYWDKSQRAWVVDNDYAHDIQEALRVARKMKAPDLLHLPLPAPVEAQ